MALFGLGKQTVAEVPIPGQETVMLPAGKVQFRYVEHRKGRTVDHEGNQWAGPDRDLELTVTPTGAGAALDVRKPRMINEGSGFKLIYKLIGTVELEADTDCTVAVAMTVDDRHVSPRVVVRA